MRLHISTFPEIQLEVEAFSSPALSDVALPGMNVRLTGNVVDQARPTLGYTGASLHGWRYYVLEYELPSSLLENDVVPELVVRLEKLAVESKVSLEDTRMPVHPALPHADPIVNSPPIPSLETPFQADVRVEEVERLISLMRESLVSLEDKTGEFLYTCESSRQALAPDRLSAEPITDQCQSTTVLWLIRKDGAGGTGPRVWRLQSCSM